MHRLRPARPARPAVRRPLRLVLAAGAAVAVGAGVLAAVSQSSQAALNPNALFVSPTGSAGAAGTQSAPTTLDAAIARIGAGGTVYVRGGTYRLGSTVRIPLRRPASRPGYR